MAEGKGSYETFDSGSGPIQKSDPGGYDHNDAEGALKDSDDHGKVPEVPQK